jgi:DNA-binding MarR family transcriptional regulator
MLAEVGALPASWRWAGIRWMIANNSLSMRDLPRSIRITVVIVTYETICKDDRSMPVSPAPKPAHTRTEAAKSVSKRAPTQHAPIELENFLPYRLSILSNKVSQAIADDYQQRYDIGVTEWRVMAVLARFAGLSAREVAERTAMDKVAVSRALARLVDAGRVSRHTHDNDKRRSVLDLTEAGWAIHEVVAPMARQREREVLAKLDEHERLWLNRILDKLEA